MDCGFETIANATVVFHDRTPVLCTDPWIEGTAYFGSWSLTHEVPEQQREAILACAYVWISHGHPDHLSIESLGLLRGKKILLADHYGSRIYDDLQAEGFDCHKMVDRKWMQISDRILVMCICDFNQDSVLLIDIDGTLVINSNDANPFYGAGRSIKKAAAQYPRVFLAALTGYGDADMVNFYDEAGNHTPHVRRDGVGVGKQIQGLLDYYGATDFLPSSSMHQYQRTDSAWANAYTTRTSDYPVGFDSTTKRLMPAFVRYDLIADDLESIDPATVPEAPRPPEDFGDKWSEQLSKADEMKLAEYFQKIAHLTRHFDFVRFEVGGKEHVIEIADRKFQRGITFAAPRNSLMTAIQYEVFDDLLIGNFMKTTLHGDWIGDGLFPDFSPYVAKYADNGKARTEDELRAYFAHYRRLAPMDHLLAGLEERAKNVVRKYVSQESKLYQFAKRSYWHLKKTGS